MEAGSSCRSTKGYRLAVIIAAASWLVITYYHFFRRGVNNPFAPHDIDPIFLSNKGLALTALFMIGLSVLVGPMAKWGCSLCGGWVSFRREIGITGAIFACFHIIISLFFLQDRFSFNWFCEHLPALMLGTLAFAVLLILTIYSTEQSRHQLGARRWKKIQRMVYFAIFFAVAHYMMMGKPANWIKWVQNLETYLPPGTLLITVFILFVLVVRLINLLSNSKHRSGE